MIDRLPYTLTTGVTATREGLVAHDNFNCFLCDDGEEEWYERYDEYQGRWGLRLVPWPDVAERLRYRKGEPGAIVLIWTSKVVSRGFVTIVEHRGDLNYIASIIAPLPDAFRVLHWCIENLGAG
jgi:hypothetical protein